MAPYLMDWLKRRGPWTYVIMLFGVAGAFGRQQYAIQKLVRDNDSLARQLADATNSPPSTASTAAPDEAARAAAEAEHTELLRLRAEVTRLRQAASVRPPAPPRASLRDTLPTTTPDAEARAQHLAQRTQVINLGKHLGLATRIFSSDHADALPEKLEDLKGYLGGTGDPANLLAAVLEQFEFHGHGRKVDFTEPGMILFRERAARPTPEGKWERTYTLMDGSVQTVTRDTDDFADFESGRTGTSANAPVNPP